MNDCKIEWSNGLGFGRQQLLSNSMEISFPMRKNSSVVTAQYLKCIKTFLIFELSQYRKSGSTFSSSVQVEARSLCSQLGNTRPSCAGARPHELCHWFCSQILRLPSRGNRSCAGARPHELCHWFCSQILRLPSRIAFGSDCQMTCTGWQGLELGLKLELCSLTNGL